jgi:hypothetical protein
MKLIDLIEELTQYDAELNVFVRIERHDEDHEAEIYEIQHIEIGIDGKQPEIGIIGRD